MTSLITFIVRENNKILLEEVTRLVDAKLAPLQAEIKELKEAQGEPLTQKRRLQTGCSTGGATNNENVEKASLWLRGPDDSTDGGRIVMGATADTN